MEVKDITIDDDNRNEILTVQVEQDDQGYELIYGRPIGEDTYFSFLHANSSAYNPDPFSEDKNEIPRESVDQVLIDRGYPLQSPYNDAPESGRLYTYIHGREHNFPFTSHSGVFFVHYTDGKQFEDPTDKDTFRIEILSDNEDIIRIQIEPADDTPPEYAIREATLYPYRHAGTYDSPPEVRIDN